MLAAVPGRGVRPSVPGRVCHRARAAFAALSVTLGGCGTTAAIPGGDRSYVPITVGPGPRYRPPARSGAAWHPAGDLACPPTLGARQGLHLELFASRRVIVLPAGVGVVAPRRDGPYIRGGRCFFPLITLEPTGVVELGAGARTLRLGDLFALWGEPLSFRRLAGFGGGPVRAFVDGREVVGDPARIALGPHLEIVLEIGGYVVPHRSYRFAPGL